MNKQAKELVENTIEVICEACLPYYCAYWEKPPLERIGLCPPLKEWLERIITPDLFLIDREKKRPHLSRGEDPSLYTWKEGQQSMINAGFTHSIIPLAEALKEVEG